MKSWDSESELRDSDPLGAATMNGDHLRVTERPDNLVAECSNGGVLISECHEAIPSLQLKVVVEGSAFVDSTKGICSVCVCAWTATI